MFPISRAGFFVFTIHCCLIPSKSSQTLFDRIDQNADSDQGSPGGLWQLWHQCSLESSCNFVVKRDQNSAFEKKQSIDTSDSFFAIWRKYSVSSYTSCKNAQSSGVTESGTTPLSLPTLPLMNTFCDMTTQGGGWTVFQRRIENTVNFNRNWTDYREGFGNVQGNLWLGLNAIHQLTKEGTIVLRVELRRADGENGYAEYRGFKIGDESSKFKLTLGTYSGNVNNAMADNDGMMFSTVDNDNDAVSFNCTKSWEGGWWHNSCFRANLNNGMYSGASGGAETLSWKTWSGNFGDITYSEMKLRKEG